MNYKLRDFTKLILGASDYHTVVDYKNKNVEQIVKGLYEKRGALHNNHVMQEIFYDNMNYLEYFIEANFKPLATDSNAGALNINGLLIPSGAGDGGCDVYIADKNDMDFLPEETQVAFSHNSLQLHYVDDEDGDNQVMQITATSHISIHRIAKGVFCITGENLEKSPWVLL